MARIIRTASAKADVFAVAEYISADKPYAAARWLEELDKTLDRLAAAQPFAGDSVEELAPNMRRQCFGKYLIFYVPIEGGINCDVFCMERAESPTFSNDS
jgi:toxin ParE1/3/4